VPTEPEPTMQDPTMRVSGWRCMVCDATVDIATPFPWRCPNSTASDRHHVLAIVNSHDVPAAVGHDPHENPYLSHDPDLAWAAYAHANGIDARARRRIVSELDAAVRDVAGVGFVPTPFDRSDPLSDALGFSDGGGVWVKDETGAVAGSQKARHLFSILLHLVAAERVGHLTQRAPLAIASCGNAALAAATLAAAANWPIDVYVPTWMGDGFGDELDRLGARIHRCERRADDPSGDPAMLRFREAVAAGSIPFTVQGPENALALDGGRTLGWEIDAQCHAQSVGLDRIFVQVGGGAFAACLGAALPEVRMSAVQVEGCAPLRRAWDRAGGDIGNGLQSVGARWEQLMTPWNDPHSLADGILDDETYDWLGVFERIGARGDPPIVAAEADIVDAHLLARSAGFDVSPTGSAGLAGLLAGIASVQSTERVAVVMSGVAR